MRYPVSDLSVVILTYNRPERLYALVQTIPYECEVIVADDGTLPKLRLPEGVKLYTHEHNGNRASTCRNEGAKLVTRPKILFLDDDVTPHGLCFAAHAMALEMYHASLGLLPRERWLPETDDRTLFFMRREAMWNWCWTGNFAIRTNTFWEIGGFDAETFDGGHGHEDRDFGRRLMLDGKNFFLNPLALAHHPSPHTAAEPSEAVLRNQDRFNQKWGEGV
jgi:glycosyltransferase involved in cell wall biosynthesis